MYEHRVDTYYDPVRDSTSSQSSFGIIHQWNGTDDPFELNGAFQILHGDFGVSMNGEESKKGEIQHMRHFLSSRELLGDFDASFV